MNVKFINVPTDNNMKRMQVGRYYRGYIVNNCNFNFYLYKLFESVLQIIHKVILSVTAEYNTILFFILSLKLYSIANYIIGTLALLTFYKFCLLVEKSEEQFFN